MPSLCADGVWWRSSVAGISSQARLETRAIGPTAIIRFLVVIGEFILAFFLIGILGFIWPAFESRKRAWHDIAAGTLLIHAQLYNR